MIEGRLHHVAYVVPDIDAALPAFTERFGMVEAVREMMPAQGVEALMMQAGPASVELIRPTDPDGAIARFLDARGPGLHHVAYAVDDIVVALERLAHQGVELIDAEPRVGLGGHLVAFIHPRSGVGALTELVQDHRPAP